ncbi:MAG TPA: hypothetical protein VFQ82_16130, partial [Stellaceae bacterium]|nr:hypothetical protein [Stellaceae bacterium]
PLPSAPGNLYDYANGYNEPGVFTVAGHGSPDAIGPTSLPIGTLSPNDLASRIRKNPKWKRGMPVRLLACNVGRWSPKYGVSFAQQLANELNTTVWAVPGPFRVVRGAGDTLIQSPENPPWVPFTPDYTWPNGGPLNGAWEGGFPILPE